MRVRGSDTVNRMRSTKLRPLRRDSLGAPKSETVELDAWLRGYAFNAEISMPTNAHLILFSEFLKINSISRSSGYRYVREGVLKITKVRSRSYLTVTEIERFMKHLERGEA